MSSFARKFAKKFPNAHVSIHREVNSYTKGTIQDPRVAIRVVIPANGWNEPADFCDFIAPIPEKFLFNNVERYVLLYLLPQLLDKSTPDFQKSYERWSDKSNLFATTTEEVNNNYKCIVTLQPATDKKFWNNSGIPQGCNNYNLQKFFSLASSQGQMDELGIWVDTQEPNSYCILPA